DREDDGGRRRHLGEGGQVEDGVSGGAGADVHGHGALVTDDRSGHREHPRRDPVREERLDRVTGHGPPRAGAALTTGSRKARVPAAPSRRTLAPSGTAWFTAP